MSKPPTVDERLAGIRELRDACGGDWSKASGLWSLDADIAWLLDEVERLRRIEVAAGPLLTTKRVSQAELERAVFALRGLAPFWGTEIHVTTDAQLRAALSPEPAPKPRCDFDCDACRADPDTRSEP